MRPTFPTVDQVRQLEAALTRQIPPEFEDQNGHMNIRHYIALFDEAGWPYFQQLGFTAENAKTRRSGVFDVQHHLNYVNEVGIGETVSVYLRLLGRAEKRLHTMGFMVNDSRDNLACTFEVLSVHVDLNARRSAPFPPDIAALLDAQITRHAALDWPAPTCGTMG